MAARNSDENIRKQSVLVGVETKDIDIIFQLFSTFIPCLGLKSIKNAGFRFPHAHSSCPAARSWRSSRPPPMISPPQRETCSLLYSKQAALSRLLDYCCHSNNYHTTPSLEEFKLVMSHLGVWERVMSVGWACLGHHLLPVCHTRAAIWSSRVRYFM